MFSRKWLINIILLGLAVFLGGKAYEDWHRVEETTPEAPVARQPKTAPREVPVKVKRNSRKHYDVVAEKNLFSSKREEPPPRADEPVKKKKTSKMKKAKRQSKRVVLYGTFSLNGARKALVQDPSARGRRKRTIWVKEGEAVAGMTVSRIETGRILLNDGVENYEIPLYDRNKPKPRASARRAPGPTIIATGTGRGATPASKVGRPKTIKPKKAPKKPKRKPKETPKPSRVKQKTKTPPKPKTTQPGSSSRDGRVANPFENLLRRE